MRDWIEMSNYQGFMLYAGVHKIFLDLYTMTCHYNTKSVRAYPSVNNIWGYVNSIEWISQGVRALNTECARIPASVVN